MVCLVIDVYHINANFAKTLESLEFPKLTKFLENLELDTHGNLSVMSVVDDNSIHEVSINFLH